MGGEVPFVVTRGEFTGDAERLAWGAAGPDGDVCWPPGDSEGLCPSPDPGEEVDPSKPGKFICAHIEDAPVVDRSGGDLRLGG